MENYPESLNSLIDDLAHFPGIGRKTAQRMAFYLLNFHSDHATRLANSLINMKEKLIFCSKCHGISESEVCHICSDERRNMHSLCVVESPADIYTFEKTGIHKGLYHVLGGLLSPLDGIGPNDLNINTLIERTNEGDEVIIATNSSIEGEATSIYLNNILSKNSVTVTKLARGLPLGGYIDYLDEATLLQAIEGRTSI